jgi:hypothetical protein
LFRDFSVLTSIRTNRLGTGKGMSLLLETMWEVPQEKLPRCPQLDPLIHRMRKVTQEKTRQLRSLDREALVGNQGQF